MSVEGLILALSITIVWKKSQVDYPVSGWKTPSYCSAFIIISYTNLVSPTLSPFPATGDSNIPSSSARSYSFTPPYLFMRPWPLLEPPLDCADLIVPSLYEPRQEGASPPLRNQAGLWSQTHH